MGVYVVQEKGSEAVKIAEIRWVDVDKIEFDESVNLRSMTEDEFRLLVRSIAENGYVEPIQVVEYDGGKRFRVLNGFHRFKVLTDVFSMKTFPVVVVGRDWDEERFLQEMIRLNSIHGEFIPERVMEAVKRINSRSQYSQEELLSIPSRGITIHVFQHGFLQNINLSIPSRGITRGVGLPKDTDTSGGLSIPSRGITASLSMAGLGRRSRGLLSIPSRGITSLNL